MNTWNSITKMKSQIALDGLNQNGGGKNLQQGISVFEK
jgi:hypothetical protein